MNSQVDAFISKQTKWGDELSKLRAIIVDTSLEEDYKWQSPCYTFRGNNVIGMRGFKEHFAIWFFKGALLLDPYQLLVRPDETAQAMRQIRFTSMDEITAIEQQLKEYIYEAIEVEKSGLKVNFRKTEAIFIVEEFQAKLDALPELKAAFDSLTPGRQREYGRYFSEAKQATTRMSRVEKCIPQILERKGLNDKYIC
ncbi:MAG: YdeI/OmpD-associated family protein [Bacteroidetes bacterium]|nr:YdeI/OmpD-associated family protein [Bacteroidota bacterium]